MPQVRSDWDDLQGEVDKLRADLAAVTSDRDRYMGLYTESLASHSVTKHERDAARAEVARLTDPAMKCRECPFNLVQERDRAREALRPFARVAILLEGCDEYPPQTTVCFLGNVVVCQGDYERAHAALGEGEEDEDEQDKCYKCGGKTRGIYVRVRVGTWGSHPICDNCWNEENPDRIPVRCKGTGKIKPSEEAEDA